LAKKFEGTKTPSKMKDCIFAEMRKGEREIEKEKELIVSRASSSALGHF